MCDQSTIDITFCNLYGRHEFPEIFLNTAVGYTNAGGSTNSIICKIGNQFLESVGIRHCITICFDQYFAGRKFESIIERPSHSNSPRLPYEFYEGTSLL